MRIPCLALTGVLVLLAGGCDRDAPDRPSARGAVVEGVVRDFQSQAGIAGAAVQLTNETSGVAVQATTDANGAYDVSMPALHAAVVARVNGAHVGTVWVVAGSARADLLVNGGTCISRYGTIVDAQTGRPVSAATVSVGGESTVSRFDGSYRVDLGCPASGSIGFNTTLMTVTHPSYASHQQVVGRGVQGVVHLDAALERQ
jgi:hypothetical protein